MARIYRVVRTRTARRDTGPAELEESTYFLHTTATARMKMTTKVTAGAKFRALQKVIKPPEEV